MKGGLQEDPRGLIFEAYRIEGITAPECRTIFLDWALGMPLGQDMAAHISVLLDHYGADNAGHPMTTVLKEGLKKATAPSGRRGGRSGRAGRRSN